jgi:hypothetical protein
MLATDAYGQAVRMPTKIKRRRRAFVDDDVKVARRWVYWHGLRNAGLSYRQISDDSGFAVSTIHEATQPEKLEWAREVLRRGW